MNRISHRSSIAVPLAVTFFASQSAFAAWQNGVSYGGSGLGMDLYTPTNPDPSPGIVVAIHYCSGNSGAAHGWFQSLADQYGFLIVTPDSAGNCFDAAPGRNGERATIVQMVEYVLEQHDADPSRVFAAGASSGACMTNALMASYPDVFAGGSVLAGVPAGFWSGGTECGACGQNPPNNSAQQWGDIVRNASGNYSGPWPRVQLWHGTSDTTLNYSNLAAEVLQWTNVLGVSGGTEGAGLSGWERTSYEDGGDVVLEVNIGQGKPHDLTSVQPSLWPDVVRFFGLDRDPEPGTGGAGGTGGAESGGTESGGEMAGGAPTGGVSTSGGIVTGGAPPTGGVSPTGGVGPTGGRPTGGLGPTGGTGGISTGGVGPTGGTGGTPTGGISPTGGTGSTSTGGLSTTGGRSTGGSTGGLTTSGGALTGGASSGGTGTGGYGATITDPGTGGSLGTGDDEPTDEGCSCRVAGGSDHQHRGSLAALLLAGLTVMLRRRGRANPSR
ncbi:MAG: PHB depolymerase family esterase [Polyangiaceae bacterium]|nr:PHB depolymerase family esterase [Polyangiaceae bacterium]